MAGTQKGNYYGKDTEKMENNEARVLCQSRFTSVTRDTEEHKSSRQGRRQIVLPIESENSHGVLQSLLWVLGAML